MFTLDVCKGIKWTRAKKGKRFMKKSDSFHFFTKKVKEKFGGRTAFVCCSVLLCSDNFTPLSEIEFSRGMKDSAYKPPKLLYS